MALPHEALLDSAGSLCSDQPGTDCSKDTAYLAGLPAALGDLVGAGEEHLSALPQDDISVVVKGTTLG